MLGLVNAILYRYPALGHANYLKYFAGSLSSVGATQLITFGQLFLVYELTQSAIQLGWLGAAMAIPNLIVTLFGGVIADRYDKRTILIVTSSGNLLFALILSLLVVFDIVQVWHVLLIAALTSFLNGFDWPTRVAIFPQLVDRSSYLSAVALNSFVWQVTRMGIPAFGGALLFYLGVSSVFALATLGHALMCATMFYVTLGDSPSASSKPAALTQIWEALAFIFRNDLYKYLLLLTFVGMFFCNSHAHMMPVFAELTGDDKFGLGLLMAAGGIGSMIGTIVIGGTRQSSNMSRTLLTSGVLTGILTTVFAWVASLSWFYVALTLQFISAFVASVFLITSMTAMQLNVPGELRGRVMGVHTMCYSLLPLGATFLGNLTEQFSVFIAVLIGSSIYVLILLLCFSGVATLRTLRLDQLMGQSTAIRDPTS